MMLCVYLKTVSGLVLSCESRVSASLNHQRAADSIGAGDHVPTTRSINGVGQLTVKVCVANRDGTFPKAQINFLNLKRV